MADDDKAFELVLNHQSRFAAYHSQKETMTWSAATLYVIAVSVLLAAGREPFWHHAPWWKFFAFVFLLGLTAWVAFRFIARQYDRRTAAHLLVHACSNVAARWAHEGVKEDECSAVDLGAAGFPVHDYQLMPKAIATELDEIKRRRAAETPAHARQRTFDDRRLTELLMWTWTIAGAVRLFLAWRPVAQLMSGL